MQNRGRILSFGTDTKGKNSYLIYICPVHNVPDFQVNDPMRPQAISSPLDTPLIIVSTNKSFTNAATFHICMDNRMIRCKDGVDGVSKLVKVLYVFDISYDPNLRQVSSVFGAIFI